MADVYLTRLIEWSWSMLEQIESAEEAHAALLEVLVETVLSRTIFATIATKRGIGLQTAARRQFRRVGRSVKDFASIAVGKVIRGPTAERIETVKAKVEEKEDPNLEEDRLHEVIQEPIHDRHRKGTTIVGVNNHAQTNELLRRVISANLRSKKPTGGAAKVKNHQAEKRIESHRGIEEMSDLSRLRARIQLALDLKTHLSQRLRSQEILVPKDPSQTPEMNQERILKYD